MWGILIAIWCLSSLWKIQATTSLFRITRSIDALKNADKINWLVDSFLREAKTRKEIRSFIFLLIRYDRVANVNETFSKKNIWRKYWWQLIFIDCYWKSFDRYKKIVHHFHKKLHRDYAIRKKHSAIMSS